METGQLKTIIKDLVQRLRPQTRSEFGDTENDKEDKEGMKTFISGFRDKNIGKPEPRDGEDEAPRLGWRSSRRTWQER